VKAKSCRENTGTKTLRSGEADFMPPELDLLRQSQKRMQITE
jgi:hypothetical protein